MLAIGFGSGSSHEPVRLRIGRVVNLGSIYPVGSKRAYHNRQISSGVKSASDLARPPRLSDYASMQVPIKCAAGTVKRYVKGAPITLGVTVDAGESISASKV